VHDRNANDAPEIAIDEPEHECIDPTASDAPKISQNIAIDEPKRVHERPANDAPTKCTKDCH